MHLKVGIVRRWICQVKSFENNVYIQSAGRKQTKFGVVFFAVSREKERNDSLFFFSLCVSHRSSIRCYGIVGGVSFIV